MTKIEKLLIEKLVGRVFYKTFNENEDILKTELYDMQQLIDWHSPQWINFEELFDINHPDFAYTLGTCLIEISDTFVVPVRDDNDFCCSNIIFDIFDDEIESTDEDAIDDEKVLKNYKSFDDIFNFLFKKIEEIEGK